MSGTAPAAPLRVARILHFIILVSKSGYVMNPRSEDLKNARHFFVTFLHQDWSIDGDALAEVFDSNMGFGGMKVGLLEDVNNLIDSGYSEAQLEQILVGRWSIGYEPEYGGFESWRDVLREIVRLCEVHIEAEHRE